MGFQGGWLNINQGIAAILAGVLGLVKAHIPGVHCRGDAAQRFVPIEFQLLFIAQHFLIFNQLADIG